MATGATIAKKYKKLEEILPLFLKLCIIIAIIFM